MRRVARHVGPAFYDEVQESVKVTIAMQERVLADDGTIPACAGSTQSALIEWMKKEGCNAEIPIGKR